MFKTKITIAFFLLLFTHLAAFSQGCSDAGFCTVESFVPHPHDEEPADKNRFKAGISAGAADYDINVFGTYFEYSRFFNEKFSLDAKLTTLSQSGNDISTFGLSDIFVNGNYKIGQKGIFTLGAKIPLMDANKMKDGLSLPMDYQSSLGTFDLVAGFGYTVGRVQLVAAIQQPLTQNNNGFLAEEYPLDSRLRDFQSTNEFQRSGDVLLRASYPFNLGQKLKVIPSLLPIYHLSNDKFTDIDGIEQEIEGSEGLTLNWNIYLDYPLNDTQNLQLILGAPFIVRDARPDGLTRSFIASLDYRISF
jgi:hypothetical protein